MPIIIQSARAEADILEALAFTLETWGPQKYWEYRRLIQEAYERILAWPLSGRVLVPSRPDIRAFRIRKPGHGARHVVFFRGLPNGDVEVVRFLHESRDLPKELDWELPRRCPSPPATAYGSAKAGLDHFAKVLAMVLAPRNIRVNVISPGPIDTPIFSELGLPQEQISGFQEFLSGIIPLGRLGRDEEVANAAYFLASDQSTFVTAVTLHVDGGLNQSFHKMPG